MNKKQMLAGAAALLISANSYAQQPLQPVKGLKWDASIGLRLRQHADAAANPTATRANNATDDTVEAIIECTDSKAVVQAIHDMGGEAEEFSAKVVTAQLSLEHIAALAALDEVVSISQARQHSLTLTEARQKTGVDKIHTGEGLETPFTGKGVIVGIIDQGFEFRHVAFLDADENPRARVYWNHQRSTGRPTTAIPSGGDGLSDGHATHVTNIAAGSRISENNLYGMAPDAELIMITSTFTDNNVMQEAKYVRDFAREEGKPWVVNMSFGSQLGPHDGSRLYDQTMSELVEPGGFIVTAMGNEGNMNLHTSYTFVEEGEKKYILFSPSSKNLVWADLWGMAADGQKHLNVTPVVYKNRAISYEDDTFWASVGSLTAEIDSRNQKEHYGFCIYTDRLVSYAGTGAQFALEITGEVDQTFHLWVNPQMGSITTPTIGGTNYLKGNNDYCVSEGSSTIPNAVAVGAYTSAGSWTNTAGTSYQFNGNTTVDAICTFSSKGPMVNDLVPRPTICAPGNAIKSAVSSYSENFSTTSTDLVSVVTRGSVLKKNYYYGVKQGTSMATPAVSGILALWLQANPTLTREQLEEILKTTAVRDRYTGTSEWNKNSGYGKINAYTGLVAALKLANSSGINETLNSEAPVTLLKGSDAWRILFNNNESYADIALYTTDGSLVGSRHLTNVRRGDEQEIQLNGYTPGIYIIRINTTAGSLTRKVVVK